MLGNDVSGTVEASRAEGFSEGDEVFGMAASGGYAEFANRFRLCDREEAL